MNTTLIAPSERRRCDDVAPVSLQGAATAGSRSYDTARFGTVQVADDAVLHFPEGLIGIGGAHYALLCTDQRSPFLWLQSLDDPSLAVPVTNPHRFFTAFAVELDDEDAELIGAFKDGRPDVLVTVTARGEHTTANLKAPILVHGRSAYQVINRASGAVVKAPLF